MYHFIINPGSRTGTGIKTWQVIEKELNDNHVPYSFYFTRLHTSATKIVRGICKQNDGEIKLIILGGDGTFNDAMNGISDEKLDQVHIGYIPTGSSNDFARSLKLSKDPLIGLHNILSSKSLMYFDIGSLTLDSKDNYKFIVSSGIGFDAAICRASLISKLKLILNLIGLGKFIYMVKAVSALFTTPYMDGVVKVDNQKEQSYEKIFFITSMIQTYQGGGLRFAPDADPTDGKLSVCIVHGLSRWKLFIMLLHLLGTKHGKLKGVELFDCNTIEVRLLKPADVHMDGEYPGKHMDYKMSCLPAKLRLMV